MNFRKPLLSLAVAGYVVMGASPAAAFTPAQTPLFLGVEVPGNLVLVPSVEWPTINSVANIQGTYSSAVEYVGYFDSDKCYEYRYSAAEVERHFYPVGPATARRCSGQWSGNFMNWAGTQTIDPFRKVLTGGLRVLDTPTDTWLEKARHDGQGGTGIYPDRTVSGRTLIEGATPFSADSFRVRIQGLGNAMRFRLDNTDVSSGTVFNPGIHPDSTTPSNRAYDVPVRVAVCVPAAGVEDNCVAYGGNAKPEGLIQSSRDDLRFSVFGYLNESGAARDGAALRSRQKYVGPQLPGGTVNPNAEWSGSTGVFIQNPNPDDVTDTNTEFGLTISRSGVINYLNLFGQTTANNHKSNDPVSELYYAAVRYMRGETNIPAYTNNAVARSADGFPVISNWGKGGHDPIEFSCQINVALGIGDIYTHDDKNLPGPTATNDEPTKPPGVVADTWINVVDVANRIGAMEGIGNIGNGGSFTGRDNSAYIAALAYWANTTDMRPTSSGTTTMSTHWVDVLEARSLEGVARNQYVLAAKYGGAKIPDGFDPMADSLEANWWHTNGETLTPFGSRGTGQPSFLKPDNYYTAGNAADMVDSLSKAFESILSETATVVTAVSTTSTRLDTDTIAVQARFDSEYWTGELDGIDPLTNTVEWSASSELPAPGSRNIFTWERTGTLTGSRRTFDSSLPAAVTTRIESGAAGQPITQLIDFIRGDRSQEVTPGFRVRGVHVLGDIVNSRPALAGAANEGWARLPDAEGSSYNAYIDGPKQTRDEVIYVGANDGMLHGFDAEDGTEIMAYVPYAVQTKLGKLANPVFQHEAYVDGQIAVGDAYNSGWKTVLVGGLGAGGRGIYALDVSNPSNPAVLWEFTDDDDADLGYTFGEPIITRLGNGTWVTVFGNGYGSANGQAYLYVRELFSGTLLEKIALGDPGSNGLSGPSALLQPVNPNFLTRIYAGDLNGTMWRVDFTAGGVASVKYANGLFTLPDNKSITVEPALAASPSGGIYVYYGSGKLIETADIAVANDRFWAVRDSDSAITGTGGFGAASITVSGGERVVSGSPGADGWYLPFDVASSEGERVLNKARVIFGRLVFSSFQPNDDACSNGGFQRLYVLNAQTGDGLLNNLCVNCGVIDIGEGAPFEPAIVLKPSSPLPYTPPEDGDPPPPPVSMPGGVDPTTARDGWCSEFGVLTPVTGWLRIGTLCDGRQTWRQPR